MNGAIPPYHHVAPRFRSLKHEADIPCRNRDTDQLTHEQMQAHCAVEGLLVLEYSQIAMIFTLRFTLPRLLDPDMQR